MFCAVTACMPTLATELNWSVVGRKANRAFMQKNYAMAKKYYLIALKMLMQDRKDTDQAYELKMDVAECERLSGDLNSARDILLDLRPVIISRKWGDELFPARYWLRVRSLEKDRGNLVASVVALSKAVSILERLFYPSYGTLVHRRLELAELIRSCPDFIRKEYSEGRLEMAGGFIADLYSVDSSAVSPDLISAYQATVQKSTDRATVGRSLALIDPVVKKIAALSNARIQAVQHLLRARQLHAEGKHSEAAIEVAAVLPVVNQFKDGDWLDLRNQYASTCFDTAALKFRKGDYSAPVTQYLEEARKIGPLPSEAKDEKQRAHLEEACMLYQLNLSRAYAKNNRVDEAEQLLDAMSDGYVEQQPASFFPRYIKVSLCVAPLEIMKGKLQQATARYEKITRYVSRLPDSAQRDTFYKLIDESRKTAMLLHMPATKPQTELRGQAK